MNTEISLSQAQLIEKKVNPYWKKTFADILTGICSWRIWLLLSWQDIKLRYRRSNLGPFWLTLSMAITIYTMGFLYGHLFKTDLKTYYPFLAAGMLSWNLLSVLIVDCTNAFVEAESYLKQMKLPYTAFIFRVVCRSLIIFCHNILVIIPIIIIFKISLNWSLLMLLPGLMIFAACGLCYGLMLAMLGARYRDLCQMIISLMQVAFFLTPIMWNPIILPEQYRKIVALNPFAEFIELLRAPLMGHMPSSFALAYTLSALLLGALGAVFFFAKLRRRIVYWL